MRVAEVQCAVFSVVLTLLWTFARGDVEVSCGFMESCILPCSFQVGPDLLIHWIQETTEKTYVHSYYHNQDQLKFQDQRFRNRTSLFKDQISRGNASLRLTEVEVQDQGRYQCYTSTEDAVKSFINLKVDAPVRNVDIQQVGNKITCSSEGIYPEPELTWSTSRPSNQSFNNTTTVQQTEQQLYNINGSLILPENVNDLDYNCTVSTDRSRRTVTWRQTFSEESATTEALSKTETVGIVVGVILPAALIVGLAVFFIYKSKRNRDGAGPQNFVMPLTQKTEEDKAEDIHDPTAPLK